MNRGAPTVIFLHIPKTGGTTLQHVLRACYPRDQVCTFKDANREREIESFKQLAPNKRDRYRLIQGHLSFGFHRNLPGDSIYITFLREPIARVQSFYYYAKSQPDHYLHSVLTNDHFGLKGLLKERTAATHELSNLQTSMIAGEEWDDVERVADRGALEQAKENLRNNFVIGLTEEFDTSMRLMGQRLGWGVKSYTKKNVTPQKPQLDRLDHETRVLLERANALDIELYQFARELFEGQRGVSIRQSVITNA